MISLRRSHERRSVGWRDQQLRITFDPLDAAGRLSDTFGARLNLDELVLAPSACVRPGPPRESEELVYVAAGALGFEDSTRSSGVLRAGEFQRVAGGHGLRRRERNASPTHRAHVFRVRLLDGSGPAEVQAPRRFTVAARRGAPCLVASPDGSGGSVRIRQDARIYSVLLELGQHAVHELPAGRIAWLHLVRGGATLGDAVLTAGDGAGVESERSVSFTARQDTEILLFDLDGSRRGTAGGSRA